MNHLGFKIEKKPLTYSGFMQGELTFLLQKVKEFHPPFGLEYANFSVSGIPFPEFPVTTNHVKEMNETHLSAIEEKKLVGNADSWINKYGVEPDERDFKGIQANYAHYRIHNTG